jgi:hypothetical protein
MQPTIAPVEGYPYEALPKNNSSSADNGAMATLRHGRAVADPKLSDSLAFYEALADSLRDQHPDLQRTTIRILGVTMPAMPEWDMSVRPFRRWHRVDFEVSDETESGFARPWGTGLLVR